MRLLQILVWHFIGPQRVFPVRAQRMDNRKLHRKQFNAFHFIDRIHYEMVRNIDGSILRELMNNSIIWWFFFRKEGGKTLYQSVPFFLSPAFSFYLLHLFLSLFSIFLQLAHSLVRMLAHYIPLSFAIATIFLF